MSVLQPTLKKGNAVSKCTKLVTCLGRSSSIPAPQLSRNATVFLICLVIQQTFPADLHCVWPWAGPGGARVSQRCQKEAAKSTLSLRCPLGPGQRGPKCRAVVWRHILQIMGAIKYYETEKIQEGSGLYKDHSGRIMENRDTRSEDQGSGGLSNSPISMLSKISNVGLSKREQIHIYSEERLRRNQTL